MRQDYFASFNIPALLMISRTASLRLSNAGTPFSGGIHSQRAFLSFTYLMYSGSFTAFSMALTKTATISFGSLGGPITKFVDSQLTSYPSSLTVGNLSYGAGARASPSVAR